MKIFAFYLLDKRPLEAEAGQRSLNWHKDWTRGRYFILVSLFRGKYLLVLVIFILHSFSLVQSTMKNIFVKKLVCCYSTIKNTFGNVFLLIQPRSPCSCSPMGNGGKNRGSGQLLVVSSSKISPLESFALPNPDNCAAITYIKFAPWVSD